MQARPRSAGASSGRPRVGPVTTARCAATKFFLHGTFNAAYLPKIASVNGDAYLDDSFRPELPELRQHLIQHVLALLG